MLAASPRHPALPYDEPIARESSIGVRSCGTHQPGPQEGEDHRGGCGDWGLSPNSNCRLASFRCARDRRSGGSPRRAVIRPATSQTGISNLACFNRGPTDPRATGVGASGRQGRTAGAAVVLGARRGGVVLPLLVIPLTVPVLIFGSAAPGVVAMGSSPKSSLLLLRAILSAGVPVCLLAAGAALRSAAE